MSSLCHQISIGITVGLTKMALIKYPKEVRETGKKEIESFIAGNSRLRILKGVTRLDRSMGGLNNWGMAGVRGETAGLTGVVGEGWFYSPKWDLSSSLEKQMNAEGCPGCHVWVDKMPGLPDTIKDSYEAIAKIGQGRPQ